MWWESTNGYAGLALVASGYFVEFDFDFLSDMSSSMKFAYLLSGA